MKRLIVFWLLLLFLGVPLGAQATTYHTRQGQGGTCNSSSTGGAGLSTITEGIQCLHQSDTLQIHNGTYNEMYDTNANGAIAAGTSSAYTIIMAAPGETPVWQGPVGCYWDDPSGGGSTTECRYPFRLRASNMAYIRFQNIKFESWNYSFNVASGTVGEIGNSDYCGGGNPLDCNPHDIEFINCEWAGFRSEISVNGRRHHWSGGSIHDGGDTTGLRHMFYPGTTEDMVVEDMQMYHHAGGWVFHNWHGEGTTGAGGPGVASYRMILRRNTISDIGYGVPNGPGGTGAITDANSQGTRFYDNVIWDVSRSVIHIGHSGCSDDFQAWNNTIVNGNYGGHDLGASYIQCGTNHVVKNNLYRNSTGGDINLDSGGNGDISTNYFSNQADPLFQNAPAHDYRLTVNSPARNGGVSLGPASIDHDCNVRVSPWDFGAYEYGATGGPCPTGTSGGPGGPTRTLGTFFMAPSGTNTTDCAAAQGTLASPSTNPMPTFAAVFPCALPGSTFYLATGIYQGIDSGVTPVPGGTSWSAPTTIAARPGATVTLQHPGSPLYLHTTATDQFLIFQNLIFDGQGTNDNVSALVGVHDLHFQNCEFKNGVHHASIIIQSTQVSFHTCNLHGTTSNPVIGLDGTTNVYVTQSQVTDGGTYGVAQESGGQPSTNLWVEKSVIARNASGGVNVAGGTDTKFYNNLIYSNGTTGPGIHMGAGEQNAQLFYNTLWNNTAGCMVFDSGVGTVTPGQATNNICWNSPTVVNNSGG